MVFYLAGLQSLPESVFEAAELEGASGFRTLVSLTVPLLSGTTVFVTTVALVNAFQTVDQLFILTQGGPNNKAYLLGTPRPISEEDQALMRRPLEGDRRRGTPGGRPGTLAAWRYYCSLAAEPDAT